MVLYFGPGGQYQDYIHNHISFNLSLLLRDIGSLLRILVRLQFHIPVPAFLREFLTSFILAVSSIAVAAAVGIPLGTWMALKRGRWLSQAITMLTLFGQAIPPLVTAMVLQMTIALSFPWFPTLGWGNPAEAILPIVALSSATMGYLTKFMQAGMEHVLDEDYLLIARSRGLPEWKVILRHAFRPSFLSVLTFLGLQTATIVSSTLLVERVFAIPGLGVVFVDQSIKTYTAEMGAEASGFFPPPGMVGIYGGDPSIPISQLFILGFMVLMMNTFVDVVYYWLDPRLRRG
ncbi:MAG: ABC transporter permease [Alicyclobacillus sp.]|nr:ABC transporter permease [Alicyclobacillus sp.]